MDEDHTQPTTSILGLLYLIRAKNKEEISFAKWCEYALSWAAAVIAEHETKQAEGGDEGGCQSYQ